MRRALAIALMLGAALPVAAVAVPKLAPNVPQLAARTETAGKPPSVAAVFQAFGLFGTWAADCARPAAPDNPHVTDVMAGPDLVIEHHDLGPNRVVNRYSIFSARRLSQTELALDVIFQPGNEGEQRQHLIMAVRDGTRRTLFNQPEGEPVRVKGGVALGFGVKTPLLRKCE